MKIVNATATDITVIVGEEKVTYPKSGMIAKVEGKEIESFMVNGVSVSYIEYGEVTGIPEPEEDVFYIVSGLVLSKSERFDLLAPNTGSGAVRNEQNQIVAVKGLITR